MFLLFTFKLNIIEAQIGSETVLYVKPSPFFFVKSTFTVELNYL